MLKRVSNDTAALSVYFTKTFLPLARFFIGDPRGATCIYASRDYSLKKLTDSKNLLYKYLLSINNINAWFGDFVQRAATEVINT